MIASDFFSISALLAMGFISLMLVIQCWRLSDIWQMSQVCKQAARRMQIWERDNLELRSALRAERAHVEQLQRKLFLLQTMIPAG